MSADIAAPGTKWINGAGGGTSASDPLTQKIGIDQASAGLGTVPVTDIAVEGTVGTTADGFWSGVGLGTLVAVLKAIALRLGAGATVQDGSGTVTTPGAAQTLFSGQIPANGYLVQNQSNGEMWISDIGTASAGGTSILLPPASPPFITPPGYKPGAQISLFAAAAGGFGARRW